MIRSVETAQPSADAVPTSEALLDSARVSTLPSSQHSRPIWLTALRHLMAVVLAVAMGAGSLWLYSRHNDFPSRYYHPDEYGKADQLIGQMAWNYHHPLLMMEAARISINYFNTPTRSISADELDVAIAGRWASAGLAAIGVTALALVGYATYGFLGLILCGATIGLCPPLMMNAHFFKEDTSLLCGIMVSMLGACWLIGAKRLWSQILAAIVLGIGCGAAASGKYAGGVTLIPTIVALFMARTPRWYALPIITAFCLITMLASIHVINRQMFTGNWTFALTPQAQLGFHYESHHALDEGHYGIEMRVPNFYAERIAARETMPHLWVFIAAGACWLIYRRGITRWGIVLFSFPLTYGIALAFNKIPAGRYALPVTVSMYLIAALLACYVLYDLEFKRRRPYLAAAGGAACLAAVALLQGTRCWGLNDSFENDSRHEMRTWVAKNLPPAAIITCDNHSGITRVGDARRHPDQPPLPQRLDRDRNQHASQYAPSVTAMARQGVSYVAISRLNWERFFDPEMKGSPGEEEEFKRNKQFYQDLFDKGTIVWMSHPKYDTNGWIDIDLRIIDIRGFAQTR